MGNLYRHLERIAEASAHQRILIASDFDGTLAPIVSHPEFARIPEDTAECLRLLLSLPQVSVAILSGRKIDDLAPRVDRRAILSGNHGLQIAGQGINFIHPVAVERIETVSEAVELVRARLAGLRGVWIESKGPTATVHFRNAALSEQYTVPMTVRRTVAAFGPSIGLRAGKFSIELHPRAGWTKGSALEYIRRYLELDDCPAVCLGDDATDESMFRLLPDQLTVCIGQRARTAAAYRLPDAHAVSQLLRSLHDLIVRRDVRLKEPA